MIAARPRAARAARSSWSSAARPAPAWRTPSALAELADSLGVARRRAVRARRSTAVRARRLVPRAPTSPSSRPTPSRSASSPSRRRRAAPPSSPPRVGGLRDRRRRRRVRAARRRPRPRRLGAASSPACSPSRGGSPRWRWAPSSTPGDFGWDATADAHSTSTGRRSPSAPGAPTPPPAGCGPPWHRDRRRPERRPTRRPTPSARCSRTELDYEEPTRPALRRGAARRAQAADDVLAGRRRARAVGQRVRRAARRREPRRGLRAGCSSATCGRTPSRSPSTTSATSTSSGGCRCTP